MISLIKRVLKCLGVKRVNALAARLRGIVYPIGDFLGYAVFFAFLKEAKEPAPDRIKKVLIIRLDRIGDLVLSTPAIRAVRTGFPQAEIHLLVSEYTKDLVDNSPNINKLLIDGRDGLGGDYDLAFALHPGFKQNYLTFKSGAKMRAGYSGRGGSFFLTHKIEDDRATRIRHEVESALEIVGLLGCGTENRDLEITITEGGERLADEFLKKNGLSDKDLIIGIHPGSRQHYIRWKKERFAGVADKLTGTYNAKILLFGGGSEDSLVKSVVQLMKKKPVVAFDLPLLQLVSLIKRCRLFISNSTGPMHIAAALKVPVTAIFGNMHPLDSYQEWGPWGEGHMIVSKDLKCPDCHPTDCRTFDCMTLITEEDVLNAVAGQLLRLK